MDLCKIPKTIKDFTQLTSLNLNYNNFIIIPNVILDLKNLHYLSLHKNYIEIIP